MVSDLTQNVGNMEKSQAGRRWVFMILSVGRNYKCHLGHFCISLAVSDCMDSFTSSGTRVVV